MKGLCRIMASLLAVTMLGSCASTYHKNAPFVGGYGETKIDDSHYVVYYNGNNKNSKDHVSDFWLYRCAQLTIEKGFTYFSIEPITGSMNNTGFIPDQGEHAYAAVLDDNASGHAIDVHGGGGGGVIFIPGGTIVMWRSRAIVAMYGDTPPQRKIVLRAQSVLDLLADYIKTNGDSTPPDRNTLFQQSAYAVAPNNQVVNVHEYLLTHPRQSVARAAPITAPYAIEPTQGATSLTLSPSPPPPPPPPPPTAMAKAPDTSTPITATAPVIEPASQAAPVDGGTPMAQTVAHQLGCGMVHPNGDSTYVAPCGSYSVVISCDGDQCRPMHTIYAKSDD